jgi:copper resistance protein C
MDRTRSLLSRFATALVTCSALLLAPVAAHAHAVLVSSTPAAHGTVGKSPLHILLRFNSRVDGKRSTLQLQNVHGVSQPLVFKEQSGRDTIEADSDALQPGSYTLLWQALASDGHITRGSIPFVVR